MQPMFQICIFAVYLLTGSKSGSMPRLILVAFVFFLSYGKCDQQYYMDRMCGGILNISAPVGDNWRAVLDLTTYHYDANMRCSLDILTSPTRKLRFHFTKFEVHDRYDALAIRDGDSHAPYISGGDHLSSSTYDLVGKVFTSYDNIVNLYFSSNYIDGFQGFSMLVQSIDGGPNGTGIFDQHCGETFDLDALNLTSYYIKSKSNYQPSTNCSIIFKTKTSNDLTVQILKSSIDECSKCGCDWLELRDGSNLTSPYVSGIDEKVCGHWNRTSTVYKTVGNSLFVWFLTDRGEESSGFELLIKAERNGWCKIRFSSTANSCRNPDLEYKTYDLVAFSKNNYGRNTNVDDGVIKGSLIVDCTATEWNVNVNMALLRTLYPGLKTSDIYLGENRCSGTETSDDLRFQYSLDECLTNQQENNSVVKYTNEIICVERNPQFAFLIQRYRWRVEVECDITADNSSAGGFKDEIILGQPGYGHLQQMDISFYLTPNFATKVSGNPLKATAGEHIYLKVFADVNDWTIKMRLKNCYIEPSLDAADNMKYYLIKDGCEVDANTHILSQLAHETRLMFDYFEYADNHSGIYVVCEGIICRPTDTSLPCQQDCNPSSA